jgi:hypothetical protein
LVSRSIRAAVESGSFWRFHLEFLKGRAHADQAEGFYAD